MASSKSGYAKNALVYIVGVIIVIAMAYVIYLIGPQYSTGITTPTSPTTSTPTTPSGIGACPASFFKNNANVISYLGFSRYNLSYNNSYLGKGIVADYVIANGTTGTMYLVEKASGVMYPPGISNQMVSLVPGLSGMGPGLNTTVAKGISINATPRIFTIVSNGSTENYTVTFVVNQSAPHKTYWLELGGAPCATQQAPMLVTIGNVPYTGNIIPSATTYA